MDTDDGVELVQRVVALDIGKAEVVCCVRVPGESGSGRRVQQVRSFPTMTAGLLACADWLHDQGVTRVVMEATSDYWRSPFYVLEAAGFETWLVNARDVKHLPGRPKTDRLDAVWLCKVAERQMLRPSFVPPAPIRALRDLTRYRVDLVNERTREKNRVEKLLEDAGIKVSVVISDIFGVSGRAMMTALIAGEHAPAVLADLAKGSMRRKTDALIEALTGRFTDHHAFLLSQMTRHVDRIDGDIATIEQRITTHLHDALGPAADAAVTRLIAIPGINHAVAVAIIAEIGLDMTRFPTSGHLTSWAKFAPSTRSSAGKTLGTGATGHGNPYLARALAQAAIGASHTKTFLGSRYRRLARRRGKKKALVAVGRSILVITWHLLSNPDATYTDLGSDHYDRSRNHDRAVRTHLQALNALGYVATLNPKAA